MNDEKAPKLYKVAQAAKILEVSEKQVRRWIASGALPHVRINRLVRICEDDLQAFIQAHRQPRE